MNWNNKTYCILVHTLEGDRTRLDFVRHQEVEKDLDVMTFHSKGQAQKWLMRGKKKAGGQHMWAIDEIPQSLIYKVVTVAEAKVLVKQEMMCLVMLMSLL